MIPFNVPPCVGNELDYVKQAIDSHIICGDGAFTKQCNAWLEERFHAQKVLLTTSGTTALDMAMLLCDIHPGDEVILPSFTFSSTATAAVLAGDAMLLVAMGAFLIFCLARHALKQRIFNKNNDKKA